MVILNHETYKEIGSYQLNLLNVYTLLSMLMVIGALLVTMLLFFTPVKRLIPGYGNTNHDDYTDARERNGGPNPLYFENAKPDQWRDNHG